MKWKMIKQARKYFTDQWLIRFCISLIKAADLIWKRFAQIITTISKIDLSKLFMMKVNGYQMQNYAPDLFTKLENLEILKIELKCDWLKCLRHLSISNWTDVSYNWTIGSIFKFRNKEIKSHTNRETHCQLQMNEWVCFQMQCWSQSSRTLGSAEFHTDLTTTHIWQDCVSKWDLQDGAGHWPMLWNMMRKKDLWFWQTQAWVDETTRKQTLGLKYTG